MYPGYWVKYDLWVSETLKFICPLGGASRATFWFWRKKKSFQEEEGLVREGEDSREEGQGLGKGQQNKEL